MLCKSLNISNCLDLLILADLHSTDILKPLVIKVLQGIFRDLVEHCIFSLLWRTVERWWPRRSGRRSWWCSPRCSQTYSGNTDQPTLLSNARITASWPLSLQRRNWKVKTTGSLARGRQSTVSTSGPTIPDLSSSLFYPCDTKMNPIYHENFVEIFQIYKDRIIQVSLSQVVVRLTLVPDRVPGWGLVGDQAEWEREIDFL